MKMYLFMKHTIKENYKYLLTILLSYGFIAVLYHITVSEPVRFYGIQIFTYLLTIANALILPSILFKNYYHSTNANHQASIPMKRFEIFFSHYLTGLGLSVGMILGYSSITTLLLEGTTSFVGFSSALLMGFLYYYHLSLLAFWICGQGLFQSVVMLVMAFGPLVAFMIYQWALETYDRTYLFSSTIETLLNLLPGVGCATYWMDGMDPTRFYSLYLNEIVGFFLLTLLAVRYRRYERTGQSMVFHSLSYVVRSIVVILGTGALFAVFGSILGSYEYTGQIITACIAGVMIAYIVEMIYKRKVKVFHSIKYGILAALVVFASVHLGIRAIDGYIPSSAGDMKLEYHDYYNSTYTDKIHFEDPEKVVELSQAMMDYYQYHEDDISRNQLLGTITFYYHHEDKEDAFFARQFDYTEEMIEKLLNDDDYRDILFDVMTSTEQKLIELASKKEPIVFTIEGQFYRLESDTEFYLFENYLKKELEAIYESDESLFGAFDHPLLINCESNTDYTHLKSLPLYNALSKTFNF